MFKNVPMIILMVLLAACTSVSPPADQTGPTQEQVASSGSSGPLLESEQATPESRPMRADLEDFGPAPEMENEVWLNTDQPLRLEDTRGKVVLLDMWTFG